MYSLYSEARQIKDETDPQSDLIQVSKAGSKKKVIILVAVATVVAMATVIGIAVYLSAGDSEDSNKSSESTNEGT